VFGFKPSNGRVPIEPPYMGRVAGPITRTVADAALAMSVLAQPDNRDHMAAPFPQADWTLQPRGSRGLRIGLLMDAGCGLPVDAETAAAIETAARLLEAEGAIVEPIRPFLTRAMLDGIDRFWQARAWADIRKLPGPRRDAVLLFIRAWAESGAALSGEEALPCPTNDVARPFEHIAFPLPYNMSTSRRPRSIAAIRLRACLSAYRLRAGVSMPRVCWACRKPLSFAGIPSVRGRWSWCSSFPSEPLCLLLLAGCGGQLTASLTFERH
jgi:hypothetical protein